ncbi:hypothetical protein FCM35_KLT12593 [Carex littledalei]|uniref:Uncharacterized protein n=1 Tax=Carex littledalei TaxID=544730 RepID=A0A833VFK0_9POAL|nr:hypothetical protein FCM35_KLT12593 [Carex littledalei]
MLSCKGKTPSTARKFQLKGFSSVSTSCSDAIVSSAITSSSPPEPPSESAAAATIALFKSYGFSDEHIDSIFHKEPQLTGSSTDRVQRKLQCFLSFGFSPAELITLVSLEPQAHHLLR